MLYLDWRFFPVFDQVDPTMAYSGWYVEGRGTVAGLSK